LHLMISLSLALTDLFLLGMLASAEAVGIYRACLQVIFSFELVLNACSAASAPIYPVLIAHGQQDQLAATYRGAARLVALVCTPALLLILFNSGDILRVLGSAFAAGAVPLAILAVGYFCKCVAGMAGVLLVVGGRPRLEVYNGVFTAALNLTLNLLLIPRFGLIGAAASTASAFIVLSLLRVRQVRRAFALTTVDRLILRIVLFCIPAAIVPWLLSVAAGIGPGTGYGHLALRLAVSGGLLAATLWTLCLRRPDREQLIGYILHRTSPRPLSNHTPTAA
jgi:O-antigen/teichoic acid export membrane protein